MNTLLTTRHPVPPEPLSVLPPETTRVPRASLIDRAAMRIGLWLLLWGSRPVADTDAVDRHRQREFLLAERERRDAEAAMATRLWMHGA
ncbi:MAG: hypothetical protein DI573_08365 [Microbacterium sp.]|jgi:hypothetical protein|uniref:hypothetical protein n=1 Tax=unclassified Microbacterium TaxID=2609290 RepID=UPI000DAFCEEA|nr:hypothetical protein [Microbacterium sp.]PZU38991.1 MAG: hypothetical protein DI573_08365 [Microbacterium sp.]